MKQLRIEGQVGEQGQVLGDEKGDGVGEGPVENDGFRNLGLDIII